MQHTRSDRFAPALSERRARLFALIAQESRAAAQRGRPQERAPMPAESALFQTRALGSLRFATADQRLAQALRVSPR